MVTQRVAKRSMMVIGSPFVEVVRQVVRQRVRRGVFKVDHDEGMVRRGRMRRRIIEKQEIAVFWELVGGEEGKRTG